MSKSLVERFDELMCHLNGEENELADKFRKALEKRINKAEDDALWRSSLEAGGVDNWCWYSEALTEGGYWDAEDDDDDDC